MVRTEISLFLKNIPGELGKLAKTLSQAGINIDALTIQDASQYVQELSGPEENRSKGSPLLPVMDQWGKIQQNLP